MQFKPSGASPTPRRRIPGSYRGRLRGHLRGREITTLQSSHTSIYTCEDWSRTGLHAADYWYKKQHKHEISARLG